MVENVNTVTCASCRTEYEAMTVDQAWGCSAELMPNLTISCSFGSAHDMTMYEFRSSHSFVESGPAQLGNICDKCIERLLIQGLIFDPHEVTD
jgi:hypothetical protein